MYSSGLRISEVLHLHYEDISRKNMQIYIRDSKTHTARYALLSKRALDILTDIGSPVEDLPESFFPTSGLVNI